MDEEIFVFVKWNKDAKRVEIQPSSLELTDDVEWVWWVAEGTAPGGESPRPAVTVSFQGDEKRGPFKKLVTDHGAMRGSGNWGPRAKAPRYSYKVVLHSPDGPKSGTGRVINRATKPKAAKPRKGGPVIPQSPTGPPD